ncbi:MAG: cytochrome P450 [Pseudomonadota bacterium]
MLRAASDFQPYRDRAAQFDASRYQPKRRARVPVPDDEDPWTLPLADFHVGNPELYKSDRIWPYLARLRDEAPVHYCADSQYGPYWSITRFDDILALDADTARLSADSRRGGITINGTPSSGDFLPMFIQMDPPVHDAQRAAVAPRLAPRSLADLEATIRARVIDILAALPVNETFDWVPAVARNLTGQMICTLLGVPVSERDKLMTWSDVFSNPDNPELVASPAVFYNALADMGEYFAELWNQRAQEAPGFDFISMLAHDPATKDMTPEQLVGNLVLLITGGNDTTRNSITGGLLALHDNPDQYSKLRDNPGLIPNMVSEIIRWQTPLTHMARTAMTEIELHGETIREGDRVVLWYISGNRDPRVIDRPDEFLIDRPRARHHLSFGFGIHRCLGNRLAEMQLRVLWEEILKSGRTIEVAGEPVRLSSPLFHGFSSLPARITA